MKTKILIVFILICQISVSQSEVQISDETLPYHEIPDYPETFTAGTVAARMVDALGFRFYWASEGLRQTDLEYQSNTDARSTEETIGHILGLSYVIINSTMGTPNGKNDSSNMSFQEKRAKILTNLKTASNALRLSKDISEFKIIFGANKIPFWNQINGPIADAIWHCGQLASFRRDSGNPINPNIDHFRGRVKK